MMVKMKEGTQEKPPGNETSLQIRVDNVIWGKQKGDCVGVNQGPDYGRF